MRDKKYKVLKYLVCLVWLLLVAFSSRVCGLAAKPASVEPLKAGLAEPNVVKIQEVKSANADTVEVWQTESAEPAIVEKACALICRGDFEAAGRLIESAPALYDTRLHRLLKIVREYQAISQRRQAEQEAAYERQLAELDKLRVAHESSDANDVNDVTKVFSVIARVREFANDAQGEKLLSDSFVKRVFDESKDKAAEFESEGKWLDAYITCYSWLQTIEPENQEYSDYAEQLVEKANIVASFQDSPCENCRERYEKVEKQMFVRAVDALNFNYVNIIDYRQMAAKAIRRCKFLADVIRFLGEDSEDFFSSSANGETADATKTVREPKKLAAWSAALDAIWDGVDDSPAGINKDRFIDIFEKVVALNATTVQLSRAALIAHFAEAALSALDPYTVMVWPRQVRDFEKTMTNEFTGIGIEITKQKGLLTVASLLPDTPAYYSGLDAWDVIEVVDGVETKDMSLGCAVRKITGPAGTEVILTIRRPGEEKTRDITIKRAKIIVPTIRGWQRAESGKWLYIIDDEDKIGYVRITSFSASTPSDLEKVLSELESRGLRGLILDLRFNSGGLLDSAVEVTDKFIKEGLIVRTQSKFVPTYAQASKKNTHPNYPLVVLINRISASASEIVSGALHDEAHKRAILVGERTVGKGSVQGITAYPGGGAQLKYTMAYYHLPSGQRVESQDAKKKQDREDWGIGPDIEIELRSDEIRKMANVQKDNDVLVQAGHHNGSVPLKRHTLEETLTTDPQLAVCLLVVKSKLIREEAKRIGQEAVELQI